ncbi:hypothetical protein AQS8620_00291 [Aquimixticola soesokkakensis]|uniref:Uncharacterized protein n=1 Tax=Aquimixticola soesokkakensis TaxID=1519096 RepID=A0A1Y5REF3_9RHOB|nr:hypothetical protein [Aquimixticola soesokkakensis]SLN15543.1 hypothetical protein AQS8620_00291 [Aquimixticola soesokkakensis]
MFSIHRNTDVDQPLVLDWGLPMTLARRVPANLDLPRGACADNVVPLHLRPFDPDFRPDMGARLVG